MTRRVDADDLGEDARCLLCGGAELRVVVDRANAPAMSNRYFETREGARAAPRGRLRIVECKACAFVYNSRFDAARVSYDPAYDGDQSHSGRFRAHMAAMADFAAARLPATPARVLEIGAGSGRFLEQFSHSARTPVQMVGYDPAWRSRPLPTGAAVVPRVFDGPTGEERGAFDVAIARHVIEHAPAPAAFLRAMSDALAPKGVLCIETPDLEWIVAARQAQDFFYEHCNYFTAATLTDALAEAGLCNIRCRKVFDGQYLWAEGEKAEEPPHSPRRAQHETILADVDVDAWDCLLASPPDERGLALWGAGAKGVTLANLIDPTGLRIKCLIDVSPDKQGKFIGVSGHAVVSPSQAATMEIGTIVVMNPCYLDEIRATARAAGIAARIATIRFSEL